MDDKKEPCKHCPGTGFRTEFYIEWVTEVVDHYGFLEPRSLAYSAHRQVPCTECKGQDTK